MIERFLKEFRPSSHEKRDRGRHIVHELNMIFKQSARKNFNFFDMHTTVMRFFDFNNWNLFIETFPGKDKDPGKLSEEYMH